MEIAQRIFKNRFFLFFSLFISVFSNAQVQENEYTNYTPELLSNFTTSTVIDPAQVAQTPNQHNKDPFCYLSLYIDNNVGPFEWYKVSATFTIIPLKPNQTDDTAAIFEKNNGSIL